MGGEGDTLVKVGRGPKLTMFYGRSVSGRYGLGAPFCSFTQQGPTKPKAKRPTIPVPVPFPAQVPYRLTSWGGSGVGGPSGQVWRGTSRLWGKQTGTVKTPHTASPAVAASIAPHLQEKSIHVKPTYLLRFSSRPRGCRHRYIPSNFSPGSKEMPSSSPAASQPSIMSPSFLNHNLRVMAKAQKKRRMRKTHLRRDVAFSPLGRPDRASRNAILDPCAPTAGSRLE